MESDPTTSVAVVMTCYNEGAYIREAVQSVLGQTRADLIDRIVIADDGSRAETVGVLKEIEGWDPRIRVIYGGGGAGVAAQRNRALTEIASPFFAILDGDDIWVADKLEQEMPVILSGPDIGLVYSDYFTFPDHDMTAARRAGVRDLSASHDLTRAYFLNDPPIIPSTALIRRSAFDACGGFDPSIRVFEDTEFFLRLSKRCRFALVDKPLLYKRNRSTSITGGRTDLMAHHALVALKAAAEEPRLLPLVTRRLAERARKLGNHQFLLGDNEEATRLLRFATQLDPFNWKAWGSRVMASRWARPARRLMSSRLKARRAALRIEDS
jgi:glycosyltransferase involved in cell wall biosynthesis